MSQLIVAVLGTGIMGSAMMRNIAGTGHTMHVWNRTTSRVQPLADSDIEVAPIATATVEGADTVITMLFDGTAAAEAVCETAPAIRPGVAWLQMTTVGPDDVAGLATIAESVRVFFYGSSVFGTRQPAGSGTLVTMTAGPASGHEPVTPILDAVGPRTVWTDEDGAAATSARLKLVINSWVIAVSNAAGEIVTPAKVIGVPPARFSEVLDGGGLDLPFLRIKADLIERGALSPVNFTADASGKDAHLIPEPAREAGLKLDGMEAFSARLDRVAEAGHAHKDMTAFYLAGFSASTKTSQKTWLRAFYEDSVEVLRMTMAILIRCASSELLAIVFGYGATLTPESSRPQEVSPCPQQSHAAPLR